MALLEHLPVDVDHVDARLAVAVGFACVVEDAQRDVARSARDVNAEKGSVRARAQERDEKVLPEAMHAERHGIVHEVVARRESSTPCTSAPLESSGTVRNQSPLCF